MTRLAILTDIHGNYPALQAIQADMQQFAPDHVIVGGDLINGAPFNHEVLETVFSERWGVIRGNHEFYVLNQDTARTTRAHQKSRQIIWLTESLKPWRATLAALPDELTLYYGNLPPVRVVHGIPGNNQKAFHSHVSDDKARLWLNNVTEEWLIFGHYHIPVDRQVDQWRLLNPGAVGAPHNGIRQANYLILDGYDGTWHPHFRQVEYDFAPIEQRFQDTAVVQEVGLIALLGYLQVKFARPLINGFVAWFDAKYPDEKRSLAHLAEYVSNPDTVFNSFAPQTQVNRELLQPISEHEYAQLLSFG